MSRDLSTLQPRVGREDRPLRNRTSILPERRDTRQPERQIFADMRNARRGDVGGAEELMRIFGQFDRTARSFQQTANMRFEQESEEAAAQGAIDAATGKPNPELEKKFAAYRRAYDLGRADSDYLNESLATDEAIRQRLLDPNDPPSVEDIDAIISERMGKLLLGPDGKPKNFGSAEANQAMARRFSQDRAKWLAQAQQEIVKRLQEETEERASTNYANAIRAGQGDFELALSQFPPGTDIKKAKADLIQAALNVAGEREDAAPTDEAALAVYDALLASKRKDGTPSLSQKELDFVRSERRQAARRIEAAQEEKQREAWEANEDQLLDRMTSGRPPSLAEIRAMRGRGEISAEFANAHANRIIAEAEARAREARTEARAAAREARDRAEWEAGKRLLWEVSEGRMSPEDAMQASLRLYAEGAFGRDKAAISALKDFRTNLNLFKGLDEPARRQARDEIKGWRDDTLRRLQRTRGLTQAQRMAARAEIDAVAQRLNIIALTPARREKLDNAFGVVSRGLRGKYGIK